MEQLDKFINQHGNELAEAWNKKLWYGPAIPNFMLNIEDVLNQIDNLPYWGAFCDGQALFPRPDASVALEKGVVIAQAVNQLWPGLSVVGTFLENTVVTQFEAVSAVICRGRRVGPPLHQDGYDLLVIHMEGKKRWFIQDPNKQEHEVLLEEGSVMHLPMMWPHRAEPVTDNCWHLAFKFRPCRRRE